jgi:hypothetical protein
METSSPRYSCRNGLNIGDICLDLPNKFRNHHDPETDILDHRNS